MIEQHERFSGLTHWLQQNIPQQDWQVTPIAGDASFRRYFRVTTSTETYIAMDAPPALEDCKPFIAIADVYQRHGIPVPLILAEDPVQGYLLMSDFGDKQYFNALNDQTVDQLYQTAFDALIKIMRVPQDDGYHFPRFDHADFLRELTLCDEWFFKTHLQLTLSQHDHNIIQQQFQLLIQEALSQPVVCVHRDYHSRNLMVTEHGLGVLDFQDALMGPIAYDLVSLLRDCYIAWPRQQVEHWVQAFYQRLCSEKLLTHTSAEQFLRWFDLAGLQRHLKCMFIFSRKFHRDGTKAFLGDIPRIVDYALDVSARYQDLQPLQHFLLEHVTPNLAKAVA